MLGRIAPFRNIYTFPSLNEYLSMFWMTIGSFPVHKKGSKTIRARLINFIFLKRLFETNLTVPSMIGLGEVEIR